MNKNDFVYYVQSHNIFVARITGIVEPAEEPEGGKRLYELSNGFATAEVFKTPEEAEERLNDENNRNA